MSSPHRISLKTNWKIERTGDSDALNSHPIRSVRAFHCPTGLASEQVVRFCFSTAHTDVLLSINDILQALTTIKGLAAATITGMMQPINRVEIRWRSEHFETLQLPEHFAAWLEISDATPVDP